MAHEHDSKTLNAIGMAVSHLSLIANSFYKQEFWCSECDHNLVNSYNPESGKFFQVHGHVRIHSIVRDDTGDYQGIIFAICAECLNKE